MKITYFECHITIDPAFDSVPELTELCQKNGFKLAQLYMVKDGSRGEKDMFMTARAKTYDEIDLMSYRMFEALKSCGFAVRRCKIEGIVSDWRAHESAAR